jgi:arylsulfatase A-like enzyme
MTARRIADDAPNIIFILTDDLGYYELGCYGQEVLETPRLDAMAAEGMRFTQCYTGAPVCAPSRSVLMTGQHGGHTRVRDNFAGVGGVPPQGRVPLQREDATVAEMLKDVGYATGIFGKWGLGEPGTGGIPNRKGFDEWFGYLNQRAAHSYYPPYLWRNQEKVELEGNAGEGRAQWSHELIAEAGLNFISGHADEPFFLYLPWTLPHGRYEIPDLGPYADMDWPKEAKAYAAMVRRIDTDVGRVLDLLSELGIDENTIVFFCSDNGAARRWEGLFDSLRHLRGNKGDVYDGGILTPMIVRWPGQVPEGTVSDVVWYFADFLPTAAALTEIEPPAEIDGVSVLPALLGDEQDLSSRCLYWEMPGDPLQQAARRGDWKAVRHGLRGGVELYDLSSDPSEEHNVAGENAGLTDEMTRYLNTAHTHSPYWPEG